MTATTLYRAYQLLIASDLVLPELAAADASDAAIDVRIVFGDVGKGADRGRRQIGPYAWCATDELWLDVPDIGRFLVQQGQYITVQVQPGADLNSVRLFLLGSAFGALLAQRGLLVLHGNAIRIGDQCMICVGTSGIGKSTLAAGFLKRGYNVLADDVVPIDANCQAIPGFARVKLWHDSAEQLGLDTEQLERLRPGLNKFNYPLGARFESQALPVRWVYVLDKDILEQPQFSPILGMQRFLMLTHNTYRKRFIAGMGRQAEHLGRCGQLADRAHVVQLLRPRAGFDVDGLIDAILADVQQRA